MYNPNMKLLIKYTLELPIEGLRTFAGYKGGDILAFTSRDKETIYKIKTFCHKLEVDTNIKVDKRDYEIFCVFGNDRFEVDEDLGIYELKDK